jgi:hypothetical protein
MLIAVISIHVATYFHIAEANLKAIITCQAYLTILRFSENKCNLPSSVNYGFQIIKNLSHQNLRRTNLIGIWCRSRENKQLRKYSSHREGSILATEVEETLPCGKAMLPILFCGKAMVTTAAIAS